MTWAMRCSDDGSARRLAWLWGNDTCTEPHRRPLDRHICVALVEGCRFERALGPCLVPPCLDQQAAHGTHCGDAGPDTPAFFRSATLSFWLLEWMLGFVTALACGTVAYYSPVLGWATN